jgi:hypothetical protein
MGCLCRTSRLSTCCSTIEAAMAAFGEELAAGMIARLPMQLALAATCPRLLCSSGPLTTTSRQDKKNTARQDQARQSRTRRRSWH